MIANWDGPRGYPWSVVRATLGGHAGLKTRAPSMRIPVIFRTPVMFTLPTQKSEATRDFAKALMGQLGLVGEANEGASDEVTQKLPIAV